MSLQRESLAPKLHDHDSAPSHGTRQSYLLGFVLSVILTAVPFWLVMAS